MIPKPVRRGRCIPPAAPGPAGPRDRGSATAELAVGMPVVVVLLLAGLTAVAAVTTKLECVDAARDAALAVARGVPAADVQPAAPRGAELTIEVHGDTVRATVRAPVPLLGARSRAVAVTATAVAAVEPGFPEPHLAGSEP
jgi:hypothetical protein